MAIKSTTLDDVISLCKRRGFVFQSAEIYGGINGIYDFGPLGAAIKDNLRSLWKKSITQTQPSILFQEGAIIGPEAVWKASGHIQNFHDPMIDCTNCKKRYRADELEIERPCPHCGKLAWTDIRQFNMMFKTYLGATVDSSSLAYLRPETAQAIFINFKNILSTYRIKIPFGIAQIGKAFRNEITPKQFLFRMREFEQMELEWFCKEEDSHNFFDLWSSSRLEFYKTVGINTQKIRLRAHSKDELSHYSSKTSDIEYEYPFGWKELEGIAHRSNFDLTQHSIHSGKDLSVFDEETKQSYIPHVIECSVGADRLFLTLLFDAFNTDTLGGEERIVLRLKPSIAPIKAAFLPLVKKLSEQTRKLYADISQHFVVEFDDSGSIGKRYRRHDEIGTPICFTFDFDSLEDNCITARNRDTLGQERISIDKVKLYIENLMK